MSVVPALLAEGDGFAFSYPLPPPTQKFADWLHAREESLWNKLKLANVREGCEVEIIFGKPLQ